MDFEKNLVKSLRDSKSLVVVTGSGVSVESGVPTFRGEDGLWKKYRAEELATPRAFFEDPELVWKWYDWRRTLISKARPNPAHEVIAEMERYYEDFLLVTQNVDGLHVRAGSQRLVEVHGNIWRVRCTKEEKESYLYETPLSEIPPRCDCGALLRPSVVWFGEPLPSEAMETAMRHIQHCDALISVGTSGMVYPVASFPVTAKARGARVIELNLEETPLTGISEHSIRGKAGDLLPALWDAVLGR